MDLLGVHTLTPLLFQQTAELKTVEAADFTHTIQAQNPIKNPQCIIITKYELTQLKTCTAIQRL